MIFFRFEEWEFIFSSLTSVLSIEKKNDKKYVKDEGDS